MLHQRSCEIQGLEHEIYCWAMHLGNCIVAYQVVGISALLRLGVGISDGDERLPQMGEMLDILELQPNGYRLTASISRQANCEKGTYHVLFPE
jgi:hypothetical protein